MAAFGSDRAAAVLGAFAMLGAGCGRLQFETVTDVTGDAIADAPSCDPEPRLDFANWPMPNTSSSGLPNLMSHTVSANQLTVTDNVTGLVWQRAVPGSMMAQPDAAAYCADLVLDGMCDWRLPERIELISIADYSIKDPAIDVTAFPSTPSDVFWSTTSVFNAPANAWYVSFSTGYTGSTSASTPYRVRCVRGGALPPATHYQTTATAVHDTQTVLTWQRDVDPGSYNHAQAQAYCTALTLDGATWRSPSINELETLVDVTASSPSINVLAFPDTPTGLFWSRDVQAADPTMGWTVNFSDGTVARGLGVSLPVRCVH